MNVLAVSLMCIFGSTSFCESDVSEKLIDSFMKTCGQFPEQATQLNELAIKAEFDSLAAATLTSDNNQPFHLYRWLINNNLNGASIDYMVSTKSGDRVCGLSLQGASPSAVTLLQKMPQFGTPTLDRRGGATGDLVVWGPLENHDRPTYTYSYANIGGKSGSSLKVIYRLN
ncbi:MAG: hypothetical protein ABI230_03870 [Aestuariivirga sp.]